MTELAKHALLRSDLVPQMIWDDPAERAAHFAARREGRPPRHWPHEVNTHVEAVPGHDELGQGIGIHRPAPWRCRCPEQVALALDYREVPNAWARHVARVTGLSAVLLESHMLVSVAGNQPVATCSCGQAFRAPDDDPLNGDAAVALWAEHVEGVEG